MWYFFYKPYYCPFSWTFIVWLLMLQNHTVSPVVWMTSNNCHAKVKRSNEGYPTGFLYERGQSEVSSDLAPVGEENLFIPQVAIQIVKLNLKQKNCCTTFPRCVNASNLCHAEVKRSTEEYPTSFRYEQGQSELFHLKLYPMLLYSL